MYVAIVYSPTVGEELKASTGTWSCYPEPTFTFQWNADGTPIPGATASTYVVTSADVGKGITVTVTATNRNGSASATSEVWGPVVASNAAPTDIALTWRSGFAGGVVPEDTATGTVLADISGTDPNGDSLTFSEQADPDGKFTVSGTTLVLSAALDYETKTSHSVTIRASDGSLTYDEAFTITVMDVSDSVPTTLNPADKSASIALTDGDLTYTSNAGAAVTAGVRGTTSKSSGKWFFSYDPVTVETGTTRSAIGIARADRVLSNGRQGTDNLSIGHVPAGTVYNTPDNNASIAAYTSAASAVDVAVDIDAKLIWFRVDGGNWNNSASADPATGAGGISFSGKTGPWFPCVTAYSSVALADGSYGKGTLNFGASAFTYAPPAGFTAWNG